MHAPGQGSRNLHAAETKEQEGDSSEVDESGAAAAAGVHKFGGGGRLNGRSATPTRTPRHVLCTPSHNQGGRPDHRHPTCSRSVACVIADLARSERERWHADRVPDRQRSVRGSWCRAAPRALGGWCTVLTSRWRPAGTYFRSASGTNGGRWEREVRYEPSLRTMLNPWRERGREDHE